MPPTTAAPVKPTSLTGRTITIEEAGDVPELARRRFSDSGARVFPIDTERVVVERHDGAFVCQRGRDFSNSIWYPMESYAKYVAADLNAYKACGVCMPMPCRCDRAYRYVGLAGDVR